LIIIIVVTYYDTNQVQVQSVNHRTIVGEENEENTRFIIVTSSSALIDKANTDELFMLMLQQAPPESCNQLVKVSDTNMCQMRF